MAGGTDVLADGRTRLGAPPEGWFCPDERSEHWPKVIWTEEDDPRVRVECGHCGCLSVLEPESGWVIDTGIHPGPPDD